MPSSPDYKGAYKIAFNALPIPPNTTIKTLTTGAWTNGDIPTSDSEWFQFIATATYSQYIHVKFDSIRPNLGVYIQMYNASGNTVGIKENLYDLYGASTKYTSRSVTNGQTYYINVTPFTATTGGTYRIAFNTSSTTPP